MKCVYCYYQSKDQFSNGRVCDWHTFSFNVKENDYCSFGDKYRCPKCKTVYKVKKVKKPHLLDKCTKCGYEFDWSLEEKDDNIRS